MITRISDMPESDLVMDVLTTTDGKYVLVPVNAPGRKTGYAYIGNPYWLSKDHPDYDEYWRLKDGDTVIGCDKDDNRAMPVADAYAQFRAENDEAYIEHLLEMDRYEREDSEDYTVDPTDMGDATPLTHNPFAVLSK